MVQTAYKKVNIKVKAKKETYFDSNSFKLPNDLIKQV